jgi:hypothetical protein
LLGLPVTEFVPRHCNNCERQNSLKTATEHIFCGTWNFEQRSGVVINAPKTHQKNFHGRISAGALKVQASKN